MAGPPPLPTRPDRRIFLYAAKCCECAGRHEGPGSAKWADDHTMRTGHDVMVDACWETRLPARLKR